MKNLKMSLTAVAVLAVVGSAVAFKAHKGGSTLYTPDASGACNQPTITRALVDPSGDHNATAALTANAPCESINYFQE